MAVFLACNTHLRPQRFSNIILRLVQKLLGVTAFMKMTEFRVQGFIHYAGGDIDMKPETVAVTTATSNSTESTVSIATSATVANDSAVTQCFQTVWESITYFR